MTRKVCCDEASPFGDHCAPCEAGAHEQCQYPQEVESSDESGVNTLNRIGRGDPQLPERSEFVSAARGIELAMRGPLDGVWVAYNHDGSACYVYAEEVGALRKVAVDQWAQAVKFVPFGEDVFAYTPPPVPKEEPPSPPSSVAVHLAEQARIAIRAPEESTDNVGTSESEKDEPPMPPKRPMRKPAKKIPPKPRGKANS